jgi:hypothetical protein
VAKRGQYMTGLDGGLPLSTLVEPSRCWTPLFVAIKGSACRPEGTQLPGCYAVLHMWSGWAGLTVTSWHEQ